MEKWDWIDVLRHHAQLGVMKAHWRKERADFLAYVRLTDDLVAKMEKRLKTIGRADPTGERAMVATVQKLQRLEKKLGLKRK